MSDKVIQVEDLMKRYRDGFFGRRKIEALRGVSLEVERGEIFGLLGPNGAGKTTLIKVLLGIVRKSGGQATLLSHPAGNRAARRRIGYLPEHHRFPRHHTGNSALEYYGSLSGLSLGEIRTRRDELLQTVNLEQWGKTPIRKYSKGMQQRLGLAQAILHDPELIILDEPTDGVDPEGRHTIRKVLQQLREEGKTIFLNSHLLQEVELVCDRVAILDQGQVRRVAHIEDLTQGPQREVEFRLVGSEEAIRKAVRAPITDCQKSNNGTLQVRIGLDDQEALDACVDRLREHNIGIAGIQWRRDTLEDAFLNTLRQAREAHETVSGDHQG